MQSEPPTSGRQPAPLSSRPGASLPQAWEAAKAIPADRDEVVLDFGERRVKLTNLRKAYWPEDGITKGDLLRYYAGIAPYLLPHLEHRAMVMRRYPGGIHGKSFFMKRSPPGTPGWVQRCPVSHGEDKVIEFPVIQDLPSLLWVVNLGCIDLNQWYAPCNRPGTPDFLHFDLDPVPPADFEAVREVSLLVHETLDDLGLPNFAKTTGSRGLHVTVPIEAGPPQKAVWGLAKALAFTLAGSHPARVTAEYRIARRPEGRVLVDYNQNAWGRTLASVYSVRPRPGAPVSTPVAWEEVEAGIRLADFRLDNVPRRVTRLGDLWAPVLAPMGRADLGNLLRIT